MLLFLPTELIQEILYNCPYINPVIRTCKQLRLIGSSVMHHRAIHPEHPLFEIYLQKNSMDLFVHKWQYNIIHNALMDELIHYSVKSGARTAVIEYVDNCMDNCMDNYDTIEWYDFEEYNIIDD